MNDILVKSKRAGLENLIRDYPEASIIDVTSQGNDPWVQLSPFFPHGNIPIPFSEPQVASSVEGVWQGLKVFEREGIDTSKFNNKTMKNIKRSVRTCGPIIGHQKGVHSSLILSYQEARETIYIPCYKWVLENCVPHLVEKLYQISKSHTIIFLDYQTNQNINDLTKPLSHAALIKYCLEAS